MKKYFLITLALLTSLCNAGWFPKLRSSNLGIDLGTRNTVLVTYDKNDGTVHQLAEAVSAVCYEVKSGDLICIGQDAAAKIGRCPSDRRAERIIQNGNIADLAGTTAFLEGLFKQANYKFGYTGNPLLLVGVPGVVNAGDTLSIREAAKNLGFIADKVKVVREPIAAAVGEGLPVDGDNASMVIDIGGGTTDIVVVSQNGILSRSVKPFNVAGDEMDRCIVNYVLEKFKVIISPETAEEVKRTIGVVSLDENDKDQSTLVYGQDPLTRLPKEIQLTQEDMVKALNNNIEQIIEEAHEVLGRVNDRAAGNVKKNGILLVGGGALLPGMKRRIEAALDIKVILPADPLHSVSKGLGIILGNLDRYERLLHTPGSSF